MKKKAASVEVRPAEASDVAGLVSLYNHYIENTVVTFDLVPVDEENRRQWMAKYDREGRYRLFVAVSTASDGDPGGELVGFATSSRFRTRAAYDVSVETSVYVAAGHHGKGIGTKLYEALFAALEGEDIHRVYAGATLPNDASVALHERFGFQKVGVFHEVGRKFGKYWDVGWWEKALG